MLTSPAQSITFKDLKGVWLEFDPTKKEGIALTFLNAKSVLVVNGNNPPKTVSYKLEYSKNVEMTIITLDPIDGTNNIPKYFIRKIDNNKIALQKINQISNWQTETSQNTIYLKRVKQYNY
jgi:hypothetical protein